MTGPDDGGRPSDGTPSDDLDSTKPTKPKPTAKRRRKRGRRYCTCSSWGTCYECQEIAERRRAAELRRRS